MKKLSGVPVKIWTQQYNKVNKAINEVTAVRWLTQGLLHGYKKARCLECGAPIYVFKETGIDFGTTFANTMCPNGYCRAIGLYTRTRGVWMVTTPAEDAAAHIKKMRPRLRNRRGRPRKRQDVPGISSEKIDA